MSVITKVNQILLEPEENLTTQGSSRVQQNLESAFPKTPFLDGYSNQQAKDLFRDLFRPDNAITSPYFAESIYLSYASGQKAEGARTPNLESVTVGGGGLPSTPFSPNVVSSPNVNHNNQAVYAGETRSRGDYTGFGSGNDGSKSILRKSSDAISKTSKLGRPLTPGKSGASVTVLSQS